jgi:hypothetical protein
MISARYEFKRQENSVNGFASQQRASTDAINALEKWLNLKPQRTYKVFKEKDEELIADLTWPKSDTSAGLDLENMTNSCGVERSIYSK